MRIIAATFLLAIALCFGIRSSAGLNTYLFSERSGTYTALTTPDIQTQTFATDYKVALPFTFTLDTLSNDSLWIAVNGYAALDKQGTTFTNTSLPLFEALHYKGVMSPFSGGYYHGVSRPVNSHIRVGTTGTSPGRVFTVEWQNQENGSWVVNFQLKLYETSNVVEFVYGTFSCSNFASVLWLGGQTGLRGADTSIAWGAVTARTTRAEPAPGVTSTLDWNNHAPAFAAWHAMQASWSSTVANRKIPASGQTYMWTPAPMCTAATGAGTLPDSITVCQGMPARIRPTGTMAGLSYQWQYSLDSGNTWIARADSTAQQLNAITSLNYNTVFYRQRASCGSLGVTYTNKTKVKVEAPLVLPYIEGFETVVASYQFPSCLNAAPGTLVYPGSGASMAHRGTKYVNFTRNVTNRRSWLMTSGMELKAGKKYRMHAYFDTNNADTLQFGLGTERTTDSVINRVNLFCPAAILHDYAPVSAGFSVAADGIYFAGFSFKQNATAIFLDDIRIEEVPALDFAVDSIVSPNYNVSKCLDAPVPVRVRMRNLGSQTLTNVPVYYRVNNTLYGPETLAGPIAPDSSFIYTFNTGANLSGNYINYQIRAFSGLPGDVLRDNDTTLFAGVWSDTVKTVPYFVDFNSVSFVTSLRWNWKFTSYLNVYTGFGRNNLSNFLEWQPSVMPRESHDSVTTVPITRIGAKTFLGFDYRVVDGAGTTAQLMAPGDTLYVLGTVDCGTTRDTLFKLHAGNQHRMTSFRSSFPIPLAQYSGNKLRIALVMWHDTTATTSYIQMDNFWIRDMTQNDVTLRALEPSHSLVCDGTTVPVKLIIQNNGGLPITNVPVRLRMNGTQIAGYTYSGNLRYEELDTVEVARFLEAPGAYNLQAISLYPSDTTFGNDTAVNAFSVANPPSAPVLAGRQQICEYDSVLLPARINDTTAMIWYASDTAAKPLSGQAPYFVKPRTQTVYYAEARASRTFVGGAPAYTSSVGSALYSGFGLVFDTKDDIILDSVAVYPSGTGSAVIDVLSCNGCSNPTVLGSRTWNFTTNANYARQMMPLGIRVDSGKGYGLVVRSSINLDLRRDFPYWPGFPVRRPGSPLTIVSALANNTKHYDSYYYFFDIQTRSLACASARTSDTILIDPIVRPAFNQSISLGTVSFMNRSTGGGSYLWSFGDGDTSHQSNPVHTFQAVGVYRVTLQQTNSCGTDSVRRVVSIDEIPVGIREIASGLERVELFPNPAQSQFSLRFKASVRGMLRISVLNALGATVSDRTEPVATGEVTLRQELPQLPAGQYLVKLEFGGVSRTLPLTILSK